MENKQIVRNLDVCGLSCPEPVLIVMDAMEETPEAELNIITDDAHAKENIVKLAVSEQWLATVNKKGYQYLICLKKEQK